MSSDSSCQLRVQSTHSLRIDHEIPGCEDLRANEREHFSPEAQISYGEPDEHRERQRRENVETIRRRGVRRVARESGLSVGLVSGIVSGERRVTERSVRRLLALLHGST